jgi:hypothetical protein
LADFGKWGREDSNLRGLPAQEPYGPTDNLGEPYPFADEMRLCRAVLEHVPGGPGRHFSYVYAIQADVAGPVKFGVSGDPAARLAGLQTAHASPLILLGAMRGGPELERGFHAVLAADRMEGEWFAPSGDVLAAASLIASYDHYPVLL